MTAPTIYTAPTLAEARALAFIDMAAKERAGIKWTRIHISYGEGASVSVTYRDGVQL